MSCLVGGGDKREMWQVFFSPSGTRGMPYEVDLVHVQGEQVNPTPTYPPTPLQESVMQPSWCKTAWVAK